MSEAWRCTDCGRLSSATGKPRYHIRHGKHCGPFAAVTVAADGQTVMAAWSPTRPTVYRQSLLSSYSQCPRRALMSLEIPEDLSVGNVGPSADLGSAVHAVFAEILRTLKEHDQPTMPTEEAIRVMYEVLQNGDWVLPPLELDELRWFTLSFVTHYRWTASRIVAIERRLSADLLCPDGKTRTVTGQPDVLLADPPDGAILVDYKSGRGGVRSPRQMPPEGEAIIGKEYLSDRGHGQLDTYGFLVMENYPAVLRVTLRELHLRSGERREATLERFELEHVSQQLATTMMLLDRALDEGMGSKLARPRPGRQCLRACPVARSCPVPDEQRGVGALGIPEAADAGAGRYVVVDALRQQLREALKAVFEETGRAPEVGDGTSLRWDGGKGGAFEIVPVGTKPVAQREEAVA